MTTIPGARPAVARKHLGAVEALLRQGPYSEQLADGKIDCVFLRRNIAENSTAEDRVLTVR